MFFSAPWIPNSIEYTHRQQCQGVLKISTEEASSLALTKTSHPIWLGRAGRGSVTERALFKKRNSTTTTTPPPRPPPSSSSTDAAHAHMHYRTHWSSLTPPLSIIPHSAYFWLHFQLLTTRQKLAKTRTCVYSWSNRDAQHITGNRPEGNFEVISWSSTSDCGWMGSWWGLCQHLVSLWWSEIFLWILSLFMLGNLTTMILPYKALILAHLFQPARATSTLQWYHLRLGHFLELAFYFHFQFSPSSLPNCVQTEVCTSLEPFQSQIGDSGIGETGLEGVGREKH